MACGEADVFVGVCVCKSAPALSEIAGCFRVANGGSIFFSDTAGWKFFRQKVFPNGNRMRGGSQEFERVSQWDWRAQLPRPAVVQKAKEEKGKGSLPRPNRSLSAALPRQESEGGMMDGRAL